MNLRTLAIATLLATAAIAMTPTASADCTDTDSYSTGSTDLLHSSTDPDLTGPTYGASAEYYTTGVYVYVTPGDCLSP